MRVLFIIVELSKSRIGPWAQWSGAKRAHSDCVSLLMFFFIMYPEYLTQMFKGRNFFILVLSFM